MIRRAPLLLLALAGAPATAKTSVTLMHDNDAWADTEQEYASGSRLSLVNADWGKAPLVPTIACWLPVAEPGDTLSAGVGAGALFPDPARHQFLYAPSRSAPLCRLASWLRPSDPDK